jgi:hypothetical protein
VGEQGQRRATCASIRWRYQRPEVRAAATPLPQQTEATMLRLRLQQTTTILRRQGGDGCECEQRQRQIQRDGVWRHPPRPTMELMTATFGPSYTAQCHREPWLRGCLLLRGLCSRQTPAAPSEERRQK